MFREEKENKEVRGENDFGRGGRGGFI